MSFGQKRAVQHERRYDLPELAISLVLLAVAAGAASVALQWPQAALGPVDWPLALPLFSTGADTSAGWVAALSSAIPWLRSAIADWLSIAADRWGVLPVLLGVAVSIRLITLPVAVKAHRERVAARQIQAEVTQLARRFRDDPERCARARRQLRRRHGITRWTSLVEWLWAPILVLIGLAASDTVSIGGDGIPALAALGRPALTCIVAMLSAGLLGLYVSLDLCTSWRQRFAIWLGLVPLLAVILALLPTTANMVILLGVLLLLLQHVCVSGLLRRVWTVAAEIWSGWRYRHGFIPLARAASVLDVGADAARLGALMAAGVPIAHGVILAPSFFSKWRVADANGKARLARRVARAVGNGPLRVHGSVTIEGFPITFGDARRKSFSPVDRGDLASVIDQMVASADVTPGDSETARCTIGSVIVQRMIVGEDNGVLATRAPDAPGMMLVERIAGDMSALATGRASPSRLWFGRRSGRCLSDGNNEAYLVQLAALGRRLEALFALPQTIEWTWDGRRLWISSSRDIGAEAAAMPRPVQREWERALSLVGAEGNATEHTLIRNAMCESLPRPTLATQSLIEALHASGGAVDLACRALGLRYDVAEDAPPLFPSLFGQLYYNVAEANRRLPKLTWLDLVRIRRRAAAWDEHMRREVPARSRRLRIATMAVDFDGLSTGRLVREIRVLVERFVTETSVDSEMAIIFAEVLLDDARQALRTEGYEPANWFGRSEGGEGHGADVLRAAFARRPLLGYALAVPPMPTDAKGGGDGSLSDRGLRIAGKIVGSDHVALSSRVAKLVEAAHSARGLSTEIRRAAATELHLLRKALLALDARLGLKNGVFLLSLDEIMALSHADGDRVRGLVAEREADRARIASPGALPAKLSLAALETASWLGGDRGEIGSDDSQLQCFGLRVAGSRRAGGRACVVSEAAASAGEPLSTLMPGDVLVAPFIHDAWLGEIVRASGVILGSGGWLCDAAIIARQWNVAMTVDVVGWRDIPDGRHVTLEMDGSVRTERSRPSGQERVPLILESSA